MTGDVGKPLEGAQRRFQSRSVDGYLESTEKLEALLNRPTQSLGLVAHSIRAVPLEAIVEIHRAARPPRPRVPHAPRGAGARESRPRWRSMENGRSSSSWTSSTSGPSSPRCIARTRGRAISTACSLRERTSASVLSPRPTSRTASRPRGLAGPGANLSLGSDSNLRIDFQEEMRLLEYGQRLRAERRGIFASDSGSIAARLFEIATEGGARSLGVRAGRIATGYAADFLNRRPRVLFSRRDRSRRAATRVRSRRRSRGDSLRRRRRSLDGRYEKPG